MRAFKSTSVQSSGGGSRAIATDLMYREGVCEWCSMKEARDLEDFRPYFGYVRGLYLIRLAPWQLLTPFGGVYAK